MHCVTPTGDSDGRWLAEHLEQVLAASVDLSQLVTEHRSTLTLVLFIRTSDILHVSHTSSSIAASCVTHCDLTGIRPGYNRCAVGAHRNVAQEYVAESNIRAPSSAPARSGSSVVGGKRFWRRMIELNLAAVHRNAPPRITGPARHH